MTDRPADHGDGRLLPMSVGAWVAAGSLQTTGARMLGEVIGLPTYGLAAAVVALALIVIGVVLGAPAAVRSCRRATRSGRPRPTRPRARPARAGAARHGPIRREEVRRGRARPGFRRVLSRWSVSSLLIGAAAAATVTGAHLVVRDRGPLAVLAAQRSHVHLEAVVSDDPRSLRSAGPFGGGYLVPVSVRAIQVHGRRTEVGGRALVIATVPGPDSSDIAATDRGDAAAPWRSLLPGQRLAVNGRLAPPRGGDLLAVVITARGEPRLLGSAPWVQRVAGELRSGLRQACSGLPPGPRGLLPGLVVGDVSTLPVAVTDDFTAVGLTHLTAVSGSNVAIVVGAVLLVTRAARAGPRTTAALATIALIGFVILARPSPSVLRAAGMGALALLALALGRQRTALPALAGTVCVLLLVDPALAVSPGFALSALATAGLILIAPGWAAALRQRRWPPGVAEVIAVPVAAQLSCGPVIALLAGEVAPVAVPANLLAAPAVAPATILGVLAAIVSPLAATPAGWLAWLAGWPARWLVGVAQLLAGAPAGAVPWPKGLAGALLLAVVSFAVVRLAREPVPRRIMLAAAVAAAVVLLPIRIIAPGWPPAGWAMVACDVGQGDAIVLAAGERTAVVVDSGPDPRSTDRCLTGLGLRAIPLVIITHDHADHTGGLAGLSGRSRRPIGAIARWAEIQTWPDDAEPAAELVLRVGSAVTVGPLELRVLGPVRSFRGSRSDINNASVVVRAEINGITALLTGDAETESQRALMGTGQDLRATVLKVPHHGSPYSAPEFFSAVRPVISIISVGADNRYGHPDQGVVAGLNQLGAAIVRTDLTGDVAVVQTPSGPAVVARGPTGDRGRMSR